MKRTRMSATVAMAAAVLAIIITTTTTIGTGIFLQQANGANCHIHVDRGNSGCSNPNSFRSSQFNYQGIDPTDDFDDPYHTHEHHGDSDDDNDRGQGNDNRGDSDDDNDRGHGNDKE